MAELTQTEKDLNMYKQLYHDGSKILKQVREALNTPEGEDIVEHAKKVAGKQ